MEVWTLGVGPVPQKISAAPWFHASSVYLLHNLADGAHHLDLRPPNDADPEDVRFCRAFVLGKLKEWIAASKETKKTSHIRTE
jgi:hypothetical protein